MAEDVAPHDPAVVARTVAEGRSLAATIPRLILEARRVAASIIHSDVVPSAFFTAICSQLCGLIHSILRMVPCNVTGLLASNSAENE